MVSSNVLTLITWSTNDKQIATSSDTLLRFGFMLKFLRNIPNLSHIKFGPLGKLMIYTNLPDYINAYTQLSPVEFEKLDYFFRTYLLILSLLFLANLISMKQRKVKFDTLDYISRYFEYLNRP